MRHCKGPNAVRTGHTARTWVQGGAATEQVHGTYAKTANQRLSHCRWCWLLPTTPQMPKRRVLAFGITPNTQHTNCNTLPAPHRPVLPPGSSLASCGKWEVACCSEKPGWAHNTAKTEVSGGNGPWDAAGGHFHGTWPPPSGRALLPAVRHPTKPAKSNDAKKSICTETQSIFTPLTFLRFWWGFQGGLRICQVPCGQKRMS
jgi:hypothetical protein